MARTRQVGRHVTVLSYTYAPLRSHQCHTVVERQVGWTRARSFYPVRVSIVEERYERVPIWWNLATGDRYVDQSARVPTIRDWYPLSSEYRKICVSWNANASRVFRIHSSSEFAAHRHAGHFSGVIIYKTCWCNMRNCFSGGLERPWD